MADRLQILHLEDNTLDAELVALRLEREGVPADVQVVYSAAEFETRLRERPPDLILADYALPGYDGLAALTLTRQVLPHVPYIFVTGEMGEELAIETLKQRSQRENRKLRDIATEIVADATGELATE